MKLWKQSICALGVVALLAGGAQGAYAADVVENEAGNVAGANDTFRAPDYYTLGDTMTGVIGTSTDVDVFEFYTGDVYHVDFTFNTTGNYEFQVWNAYGYLLDYVVGSGTISLPIDYSGDGYFVRVIGKNDSGDSYTFTGISN